MQLEPGPMPRYNQLKSLLERRILSGEVQPGDQFPTDRARGTFVRPSKRSPVFFRLADGISLAYETRYMAYGLCPQLLEEDLEQWCCGSQCAASSGETSGNCAPPQSAAGIEGMDKRRHPVEVMVRESMAPPRYGELPTVQELSRLLRVWRGGTL